MYFGGIFHIQQVSQHSWANRVLNYLFYASCFVSQSHTSAKFCKCADGIYQRIRAKLRKLVQIFSDITEHFYLVHILGNKWFLNVILSQTGKKIAT